MAGLTLDAGALIAVERNERVFLAFLARQTRSGVAVSVPSVVVAQVWRGPRTAQLGRFLKGCALTGVAADRGFAIGELLARAGTTDVVDAILVLDAAGRGDALVTGDMADINRLAAVVAGCGPVIDLNSLSRL